MTTSIYTISVYYEGEFVALPVCDLSKLKFVRTREGLARVREKIDGKISVFGASFDLIATLKESYGEVDYQIFKNNVLYFGGKLILNSGTFDYTKKFAELSVNYEDTYIDFLSGYDVEKNILQNSENLQLSELSTYQKYYTDYIDAVNFPGWDGGFEMPETWDSGTTYTPNYTDIITSEGFKYRSGKVGTVVNYFEGYERAYICIKECTNVIPYNNPEYWYQLEVNEFGSIIKLECTKLSFKYSNDWYPLFTDTFKGYCNTNLTPATYTRTMKGYSLENTLKVFTGIDTSFIEWYYANTHDIYVHDKSDMKRPDATQPATINNVSLKTLLENLLNLFQIDWYIGNGYLYLIDYYTFSLETYELDLSNYSKVTTYSIEGEKPMKEIWSQEQSDDNFARFEIKYNNYGENVKEYTCADVNNNITFLSTNPSTASDSGRTFSICEKKTLSVPAKIPISNGIVNYLCSANELKNTLLQYRRPWEKDINGNVFESVAPDKQVAEIITENMDIFSINFLKFVKISLSENCEIQSVTEEFKSGKMIFNVKF